MIKAITLAALSDALEQLKKLIKANENSGKTTVIFCEDRLTLAAERTVCQAVEGTFNTYVYTFSRFLATQSPRPQNILSGQGSAMAVRKIIDENRDNLHLFARLSSANAAQEVYDTLALLYASRVTPDDLKDIEIDNRLLQDKIDDLSLIYTKYSAYLKEKGYIDRNSYMRGVPEVISSCDLIRCGDVIFLGFDCFTCSVAECARACMDSAKNVYGIFIGGKEDIYSNEALTSFERVAKDFGGTQKVTVPSALCLEAEHLRRNLFNPEAFYSAMPQESANVRIYEATDCDDELEYIAANIIKHVCDDGIRYREICVMLPDLNGYANCLQRVFSQYKIPFYIDKRFALYEHPICSFICNYLTCAAYGCLPDGVNQVISSPIFGAKKKDRDIFINYSLRLADFRGGVKRQPLEEILSKLKFDVTAVNNVRSKFLEGLNLIPKTAKGDEFCTAIKKLLALFKADEVLEGMEQSFKDEYPSLSALSGRAYDGVNAVLDEAQALTSDMNMTAAEFCKILKSGFTAMEISLIPLSQDVVFVGDISKTENVGSKILFAAGLNDGVPAATQDAAILTDRELSSLDKLNVVISPKIQQVNMRTRQMTALNICSFKQKLYLSYPSSIGGEERASSRIIAYAKALFKESGGNGDNLVPYNARLVARSANALPYYSSRPLPALKQIFKGSFSGVPSAIYAVLCNSGYGEQADKIMGIEEDVGGITCGKRLYGGYVSPTALETYFDCPYKSFLSRGLKLSEREEGVIRPLDTGNFIHTVLQKLADKINKTKDKDEFAAIAKSEAENLIKDPAYSALSSSKRGQYIGRNLIYESVQISLGMFEQVKNSNFVVDGAERKCEIDLGNGIKLFGFIDRVDGCGDMIRIIDYKTGTIESNSGAYYMGIKLQLPLYLLSAARGKRPVGAYYFPAQIDYSSKEDGVFRLKGYMDGSDDVILNSDTTIEEKAKSKYFDAYYHSTQYSTESAMAQEDFIDFLQYSALVSRNGAKEMAQGNVKPSPYKQNKMKSACNFCKYFGSCHFVENLSGEMRETLSVNCKKIAQIVRKERGDED